MILAGRGIRNCRRSCCGFICMQIIWVSSGRRIIRGSIRILSRLCRTPGRWRSGSKQIFKKGKMSKNSIIRVIFWLLSGVLAGGCHKSFLDQKPSTDLLIPNTMPVLQELMDNTQVMNISPALGEFSADNFYLMYSTWLSLDIKEANAYIWAIDLYEGQGLVIDWDIPYQQVFYSNTVLQGLAGIQPDSTNQTQWNTLEGTALFSRAFAFFNVAELFAEPYDSATAASDPGIPLRLSPDINEKTT